MLQRTWPRFVYPLVCTLLIVAATLVALRVATTTAFDAHPDEVTHADAFCYYETHWWPPDLNADGLRYNPWGMTRLHEEEIVYFFFGKIAALLRPVVEPQFATHVAPIPRANVLYLPVVMAPDYCFVAYYTYRLINVLLLIVTLATLFWAGRRLRWMRHLALLILAVPMAVYVYGYGNSDAWGSTLAAFLLLFALHTHERDHLTWREAIGLGVLTGLVLLSKRPFWMAIPLAYIIVAHKAFTLWQRDSAALYGLLRVWIPLVFLVTFLLILPQKIVYPLSQGDYAARVIEMREQRARIDLRPSSTEDRGYLLRDKGFPFSRITNDPTWWRLSYQSFYGYFGYWRLPSPAIAYAVAPILVGLGVLLTYVDFFRRRAAYSLLLRALLIAAPLLCAGLLFSSLYYSWIFDAQPQGRYFLPTLLLLAPVVGGATDDEPRWLRGVRWVIWALLLGLSFYTLWTLYVAAPTMIQ